VGPASELTGLTRTTAAEPESETTMITAGTILIEQNTAYPQCFQVQDAAYPGAWRAVTHILTPREFESELSTKGWTFFYMANSIRTISFGFSRAKMIHSALQRLIAGVRKQNCNCLEVDRVTMHRFLGIPYVSLTAHPRHIQKGMTFSATADAPRPNMVN
jgi:hypothetical protein